MADAIFVTPVPFLSSRLSDEDCKTWPDIASFLRQDDIVVSNHRGRVAQPLYCLPYDTLRESLHVWLVAQGFASAEVLSHEISAVFDTPSCSLLSIACLPVYLISLVAFPTALCGILQVSNVLACNVPTRIDAITANMISFNKLHKHIHITFAVTPESDCCADKSWMPLRQYQQRLQLYICYKSHITSDTRSPMSLQMSDRSATRKVQLTPLHRMDNPALQTWLRRKMISSSLLRLLQDYTGAMLLEVDEENMDSEWTDLSEEDQRILLSIIREAKSSRGGSGSDNIIVKINS